MGDVQLDSFKARVPFWDSSALEEGKSLSGGEKAGWSPGTLRKLSKWASLFSAGPLAFDL